MVAKPEKAWLLLTKDYLYLMSSDQEKKYYDCLKVEQTKSGEPILTGITEIGGVPEKWFEKARNLVVNLDKKVEPTREDKATNAWLLLTKDYLYLMSSSPSQENKYFRYYELGRKDDENTTITNIKKIGKIPDGWFINPRNLVVNFEVEGLTPV